MKTEYLTVKVDSGLKERVGELARQERRSLADQTLYLMELGLKALERDPAPAYVDPNPRPAGGLK